MKRLTLLSLCLFGLLTGPLHATEKADPLEAWKPKFDPSKAQFTYILSNVDHPAIEGIAVGYHIRDKVWERSNGRLYVDFRPMAQLGGERDVISKLKLGAVHGMLCSSVAAVNVADRLGIVNLPFVIDSFDKLEKFRRTRNCSSPSAKPLWTRASWWWISPVTAPTAGRPRPRCAPWPMPGGSTSAWPRRRSMWISTAPGA
jgi:TRAP-type C4-dicarboxylate transport system substrate-binding protein